ncbi:MAG: holo-ACP synthase [Deltaproteobacteria bacterium]|jgi:holo-[acyl-carrier protein] synthase
MIYGTGIDLVSIERMERVILRWGDRFLKRVFTAEEIRFCHCRPCAHAAFALRFAAKEAFSKALGLGMRRGVLWRDIEVFHDRAGKPGLKLRGISSKICRTNGIRGIHLSLSDDGDYGVAVVILEQ